MTVNESNSFRLELLSLFLFFYANIILASIEKVILSSPQYPAQFYAC